MESGHLGAFEHVVLISAFRLGDASYGALIRAEIEAATRRSPSAQAVAATLERLERKGLVSRWVGAATPERGGRAKRHVRVEGAGVAALRNARDTFERLHVGLSFGASPTVAP